MIYSGTVTDSLKLYLFDVELLVEAPPVRVNLVSTYTT